MVSEILSIVGIHPSIIVVPWFRTLFSAQLDFEVLFKLWDVLFLKGEIVIFRIAIVVFQNLDLRNKEPHDIIQAVNSLDKAVATHLSAAYSESILSKEEFDSLLRNFKE